MPVSKSKAKTPQEAGYRKIHLHEDVYARIRAISAQEGRTANKIVRMAIENTFGMGEKKSMFNDVEPE